MSSCTLFIICKKNNVSKILLLAHTQTWNAFKKYKQALITRNLKQFTHSVNNCDEIEFISLSCCIFGQKTKSL